MAAHFSRISRGRTRWTDARTNAPTNEASLPRSLSLSLLFLRIKSAHMAGISIVIIRCHREPRATLTDDEK